MRSLPILQPRSVEVTVDGAKVAVREGATLLDACKAAGVSTPTLCFAENLTPVNVCRVCVVELEGARTLVPSCSRKAEAGMVIRTDSDRVRLSRKLVLELLASSVDLSTAPAVRGYLDRYGADPARFGPASVPSVEGARDASHPGPHHASSGAHAATVAQPVKVDNDLYVRDYAKCILCYKCVEACGADAQNTFAIAVAGRGFEARISTELAVPLPDSACVYCGNCIGVCPTGALAFKSEHDLRAQGAWDEARQAQTDTICPYCGVGCALTLHVQDERIVKVTSPVESSVTNGQLCIKGRFGFEFVQNLAPARLTPRLTEEQPGPPLWRRRAGRISSGQPRRNHARHRFTDHRPSPLAALSLAPPRGVQAAPDPFIGTYDYNESLTPSTITSPVAGMCPAAGTASGTLTHHPQRGASGGYVVTIEPPGDGGAGGPCALQATEGAGDTLAFAAGQTCAVSAMGATGTATLTSGSGSISGSTLKLDLAYTVAGTSPMGSFTATTVDSDTATRQ